MPIERVSRYNDGTLAQIEYKNTGKYQITVFRSWPESFEQTFFTYTWIDGDALPLLANRYCGGSKYWWEIMDINPEITDPFSITPGTIIRIPYGQ